MGRGEPLGGLSSRGSAPASLLVMPLSDSGYAVEEDVSLPHVTNKEERYQRDSSSESGIKFESRILATKVPLIRHRMGS